jgi:maleate isomerase
MIPSGRGDASAPRDGHPEASRQEKRFPVPSTHRFGLITPSPNTVQEQEFSAVLPECVSLHTARIRFKNIDVESLVSCVDQLEAESCKLADADVGVIVFAAMAPSMVKGKGYDRDLIRRMEAASGKPATTAATAFVDALKHLGKRRIAIAAPWSAAINDLMIAFMEAHDLQVVASEFAGFSHGSDLVRGGSQKAYELGRQADRQEAEAIIMPGGNWPAMDIIEQLEAELGKPVLTNNATSLWAGLRLLGIRDGLHGCGRLLRDHL